MILGVRPEALRPLARDRDPAGAPVLSIDVAQHLGHETLLDASSGSHRVVARVGAATIRASASGGRSCSIRISCISSMPKQGANLCRDRARRGVKRRRRLCDEGRTALPRSHDRLDRREHEEADPGGLGDHEADRAKAGGEEVAERRLHAERGDGGDQAPARHFVYRLDRPMRQEAERIDDDKGGEAEEEERQRHASALAPSARHGERDREHTGSSIATRRSLT